jgi:hypothetical protein
VDGLWEGEEAGGWVCGEVFCLGVRAWGDAFVGCCCCWDGWVDADGGCVTLMSMLVVVWSGGVAGTGLVWSWPMVMNGCGC